VELLGLCQFLPGGNIINLSVALGMKFRGWKGALAGITGLIAVPSMVVILLGMIYQHFQRSQRQAPLRRTGRGCRRPADPDGGEDRCRCARTWCWPAWRSSVSWPSPCCASRCCG
jgi:hypothetical protein